MLLVARYVLPVGAPHIDDGAVLVRDAEIVEVGSRADLQRRHPDEEVLDYGLAALMPGFVDLHTHLEYATFRGVVDDLPYTQWKMAVQGREHLLSEADWADSAVLGAIEAIRSGITTIADVTDSGASVAAANRSGLRGVVYREVQTMDTRAIARVMDEARADMDAWGAATDASRITIGIAPHGPYTCHPRLFQAVTEEVQASPRPVAIHLAGSKDEYDFVKYGSSPLGQDFRTQSGWAEETWLPTGVSPVRYVYQWEILDLPNVLAVHCVHVDPGDVGVLERADVSVAYCARCNAKLGMGTAPLRDFKEHGLRVGIGTDSPASTSTIDFFEEMRVGLLVQRGMHGEEGFFTAQEFVRMATLDGARALKMDALVGTLEPGKRADIIAVDLSKSHQVPTQNPYGALVHTCNQDDVLMTMVEGRLLYDRGRFHTLDPEAMAGRMEELRLRVRG